MPTTYQQYYQQGLRGPASSGAPMFRNGMGLVYENGQPRRLLPGDSYNAHPGGGGYSYQRTVTGREGRYRPTYSGYGGQGVAPAAPPVYPTGGHGEPLSQIGMAGLPMDPRMRWKRYYGRMGAMGYPKLNEDALDRGGYDGLYPSPSPYPPTMPQENYLF